jgi:hypothetical protein
MRPYHFLLACALIATTALPVSAAIINSAPFTAYGADADLTMDNVTKAYMVAADIDAKGKAEPAFKAKIDGAASPDAVANDPDVSAMCSKAGIDPAEFISVLFTYVKAAIAAGVIKGGSDRAASIASAQSTEAAVDFILTNYDALKALDGKYPNGMMQTP